jgi:hypothetical protein
MALKQHGEQHAPLHERWPHDCCLCRTENEAKTLRKLLDDLRGLVADLDNDVAYERDRTSRLEEALREEHVRIHPNPKRWEPGLGPNVCDVCALIYWRETPGTLESESRV